MLPVKAPVNNISISDLNVVKIKKNSKTNINKNFSYTIKIADFYFKGYSFNLMLNRIKD